MLGEIGTIETEFFSYPDGSGGVIYAERTADGAGDAGGNSLVIGAQATKAYVDAIGTFFQAGGGAVARNLQAKLRDSVHVLDFHATGTVGVSAAVDTAALNAALDTGKSVEVPDGNLSYIPSGKALAFGQYIIARSPLLSTINKVENGDMFTAAAGCGMINVGLQGNGTGSGGATGRGLVIPAGTSNINLINCNFLDMLGYCLEITAAGGGSQLRIIGGLFNRTDSNEPAMKLGAGDVAASPRSLIGVDSTGVLVDLTGTDNTLVTGCYTRNIIFGTAKKAVISGTRISTIGETLSITGTDNAIVGCPVAGDVEFGAGASNCHFKASPIASGSSFADDSGNSTNSTDYVFRGSVTYDPPSIPHGGADSTTVACPGAKLGMFASASFSISLAGVILDAYVSAADTVTVRFQNESGGTINLVSGTLKVRAIA
ncbi:hypothetical protein [Allopontixanthobacter sediminis]|uniref:Uncharacterized protein n=1 Tax=Allopontixanthobacter sediminis TaxID=1689985 RepID=A0A845B234_9SPHN|nr:hypothetical protein [Allopontixanthobacter sediminis]MXP43692.1 hypothetical protein [Allopontixanthobacter sediminis]